MTKDDVGAGRRKIVKKEDGKVTAEKVDKNQELKPPTDEKKKK